MLVLKIKLMPESPQTDLKKLLAEASNTIEKCGGKFYASEEQPIAFGLKALIITATWPDDKSSNELEDKLSKLKNINSSEIVDVRRAVG